MSDVHAVTKLMSAVEFFDWIQRPENEARHFELVRGEVVEVSRPGERHSVVCGNVSFVLNLYVRQRGDGLVGTNDPGVIVERGPDTVRGPDVVFFQKSKVYEELNPKFIEDPPLLAVEVLSPNDRTNKLLARAQQFFKGGIRAVWLVDPESRDVTVHCPGKQPQVFTAADELVCEDILPGFRCRVSDFFFTPGSTKTGTSPNGT